MVPSELLYSRDHEWLRVEGEIGTLGITDHAQSELGDIVFLELPEPGRIVQAGDEFGTVESVKAVSEIFSPVSGEVIEVNLSLTKDPDNSATVNKDPYGEGWLVRIRLSDPQEVNKLLSPDAYSDYMKEAGD